MPLLSVAEVRERLSLIFPEAVPDRRRLTRELSAKTIVTFLFVRAVGDPNLGTPLLRPSMVTWMDDESLRRSDDSDFVAGWHEAASRGQRQLVDFLAASGVARGRWYADNSREPIRDEVIRPLSERYGAVLRAAGTAPTGGSPALSLAADFAQLFRAEVDDEELREDIAAWQDEHLSPAEQARLAARRRLERVDDVAVVLPGRGERRLPPGESSVLAAAVIEQFAPRALAQPYTLAICHARDPLAGEDERELEGVGLTLDPALALPDVLLLDAANGTLWFVEVVVSDGPIHERRRAELAAWARARRIEEDRCRFVTVYRSRVEPVFRRTVGELAWDSFVWFADEPENVFRLEQL